jgi:hypothetical protein
VHTGCWRAHRWLEGGRRAVGAQGRGAVWAGVAPSNNRLHPTPGVYIGGMRRVRPARVKLGRSAAVLHPLLKDRYHEKISLHNDHGV